MAMEGTVQYVDDGVIFRFERDFPQGVDEVWAALTESERICKWLGAPGSTIEPRVGGRVHLTEHGIDGAVVDLEPQRVIEFEWRTAEWEGGTVRWEISPTSEGTHLVLTHHNPPIDPEDERRLAQRYNFPPDMIDSIPRNLAGWHTLIDGLALALAGGSQDVIGPEQAAGVDFKPIHEHYKKLRAEGRV